MPDRKFSILLIDDDRDFRDIMAAKLTGAGFMVYQAENGQKGIEQLREHRPDLVLLDVQMPVMSGISTLSAIRSDPELADTKAIFLTNMGESTEALGWIDDKFAKDIGALGHIRKSDDLDSIVGKIEAIMAADSGQRSAK